MAKPKTWNWFVLLVGLGLLANAGMMFWNHVSPGDAGGGKFPMEFSLDRQAFAQAMENGGAGGAGVGGAGGSGGGLSGSMLGAHGFYMMPAQLGLNTWGLYLMDVESGTICVYKANPENSRFKLMAVRYFRNDRFLNDFNNESPTPREVQKQVEQQRQREQIGGAEGGDKK